MFAHGGAGRIHVLGRILVNLSSCVVLDRFQALESVASLEAKARELMRQNSFLASKYSMRKCTPAGTGSPGACHFAYFPQTCVPVTQKKTSFPDRTKPGRKTHLESMSCVCLCLRSLAPHHSRHLFLLVYGVILPLNLTR